MLVYYLANVGNRDVWIDGAPIAADQSREVGERAKQRPEEFRGRFTAPILEAGIGHVLRHGTETDAVRVRVYLFATNQPESAGPHRLKDTGPLAEVLERTLPERLPPRGTGKLDDVKAFAITCNPSDHDEMYDYFGRQLAARRFAPELADRVYVSPVGGVPAANFALLLRAIERYEAKCYPIYISEGSRTPTALNIGERLRVGTIRGLIRQELAHDEFGRAAGLLRQIGASRLSIGLAEHANFRLHFDFRNALRSLEDDVEPESRGSDRDLARQLRAGLEDLLDGRHPALCAELIANALIAYRGGRYVDFLLRMFRLQEAMLRLIVEQELALPTDVEDGKAHPDFVRGIEFHPALAGLTDKFAKNGTEYHRGPTTWVLRQIVDRYLSDSDATTNERLRPATAITNRLEALATLRNKSIGAHGFQGVSAEEIARGYGAGHDLIADLNVLARWLGAEAAASPFDRIRDAILARLDAER